jgi:hypothetical protein
VSPMTYPQKRRVKFHEATHIAGQLYGVPHGIIRVFNTIFYPRARRALRVYFFERTRRRKIAKQFSDGAGVSL